MRAVSDIKKWKTKSVKRILALFLTILQIVVCFGDEGPKPVLFVEGKTVAEVVMTERGQVMRCNLIELEEPSEAEAIVSNRGLPVKYPSFKNMLRLINDCSKITRPPKKTLDVENATILTDPPPAVVDFDQWTSWSLWRGILPGTKWCGMGDIATSFDDLGPNADVDSCCRAHDHCPVKLKAFRTGYGIINLSFYTKSHCDCDRNFYGCLKESGNKFSDAVGNFYFNVMRVQCLKDHRPFVCVEYQPSEDGSTECVKWTTDSNSGKMRSISTPLKY